MGVDHGGGDIFVAEEFLHRPNIRPAFEQVRRKGMPECMTTRRLLETGLDDSLLDCPLQQGFHEVMALLAAGAWIDGTFWSRKDVLPAPIPVGVGIFAFQRVGQMNGAEAFSEVFLVFDLHFRQVQLQRFFERFRENGDAVLFALAIADEDLLVTKVDVLHPEANTVHQAQAGAIEQIGHEPVGAGHLGQDGLDFVAGEDDGQADGAFGAFDVIDPAEGMLQHSVIQKQQCAEGLILSGSGDLAVDGEMGQESADIIFPEFIRVLFAMEKDKAANPLEVGFLGADGIMPVTANVANLVQEFRLAMVNRFF